MKRSDAAQHKALKSSPLRVTKFWACQQPGILFPNTSQRAGMETSHPPLPSDAGHSLEKSAAPQLSVAHAAGVSLRVHAACLHCCLQMPQDRKMPVLVFFRTILCICSGRWSSCPLAHKSQHRCRNVHKNIVGTRHIIVFTHSFSCSVFSCNKFLNSLLS